MGTATSKWEYKESVWDMEDEQRFDLEIVETYIPVIGPLGKILGSYEIYLDVTGHHDRFVRSLKVFLIQLVSLLILIFSVVCGIVYLAEKKISKNALLLSEEENRLKQMNEKLQLEIVERKKARDILKKKQEELEASEDNLKKFSREILSIREEEKRRLSRDLHDDVGGTVVSIISAVGIAERDIKKENTKHALEILKQTKNQLQNLMKNLRKIAINLRPPDLGVLDLSSVLQAYFFKIENQEQMKIDFNTEINNKKIDDRTATVLYRVAQEALTNIIKHARAKNVKVRLYSEGGNIKFSVNDDGRGFSEHTINRKGKFLHIGILGMKERTESLGGSFELKSQPGRGTTVSVTLPLKMG
jgi:signal transduction histidine kinase